MGGRSTSSGLGSRNDTTSNFQANEIYHVVRNGQIVFTGTEEEAGQVIAEDMSGELEMYPDSGRVSNDYIASTNSFGQTIQIPRSTYEARLEQAERSLAQMYQIQANPNLRSLPGGALRRQEQEIERLRRILREGRE